MIIPLSKREEYTQKMCSVCKHLVDGECDTLVRLPDKRTFVRLIRMSRTGCECQLFHIDVDKIVVKEEKE